MAALEDSQPSGGIRGIVPGGLVTVVNVQWSGSDALVRNGLVRSRPKIVRIAGEQRATVETQGVLALDRVQELPR